MQVHKVTLLIIDHDRLGEKGVREEIENARFPNDCMNPKVKNIETVDIGEWRDDHPLNIRGTADDEYKRLFP